MTTSDADMFDFWIDRGGTFTDVIGRSGDGRLVTLKLLSSSPAYADAAVEGMRRMLRVTADAAFPASRVGAMVVPGSGGRNGGRGSAGFSFRGFRGVTGHTVPFKSQSTPVEPCRNYAGPGGEKGREISVRRFCRSRISF